ncbi:MAG: M15 family metallopeptidase [Clostridia bacterium]|nr:M15 family metallopeptidase [Clostridia bacterium]
MKKKRLFLIFVLFALVFALIVERADFSKPVHVANMENGWQLILVNSEYKVPESWESEFVTLSCGEMVDKRIYPDLQDMFDTALSEGIDLVVRSGYRSEKEQKEILIKKIGSFRKEGYGNTEAAEKATDLVSMPGTSEHQLGIAVDINAENGTGKNEAYKWLSENSYRFGFIVRYPSGKSHITGISYEPWHFRYVGKDHAKRIYESGQCLEEYLQQF